MVGEDEAQLVGAQRLVAVREADAAVELRVTGETLLEARPPDQDEADLEAVKEVT